MRCRHRRVLLLICLQIAVAAAPVNAYPIDGYEESGIRRLEHARRVEAGDIAGSRLPDGATHALESIDIRLVGKALELPRADAELGAALTAMLADQSPAYGIALLDLTDPNAPVYAQHRDDARQNVGSVGKLVAALGLFQGLADAYPDNVQAREHLLRSTQLVADRFSHSDHHKITLFDVDSLTVNRRPMRDGDTASLYEYLDWMLSVSSNSAAAMVMRDAMMLRELGSRYPLPKTEIDQFFDDRSRAANTALFKQTFWEPVTANGISLHSLRQGSFFTGQGKAIVDGGGLSYATPRSLIKLVLGMERGQLVDEWSSRTLKRLIYLTERRIRFASAPSLRGAAVYYKSGSLYSCREEEGFRCGAYKGNVKNYMSSLAIIEDDRSTPPIHYAVALVSNVLRENSAVAHQTLAGHIHQLIKARHWPAAQ